MFLLFPLHFMYDSANSLPLNRPRRLGRQVVQHPVHAVHLVGDAVGDLLEEGEGHVLDSGGHGVNGVDGTEDDRPGVGALAVPDADGFQVGDDGEVLPDLTGETRLLELFPQDSVGLPDGLQAVPSDGAQAADPQAGPGKGWR